VKNRQRQFLVTAGWLAGMTALYVGLLLVEGYWNLFDWEPKWNWTSLGLAGWLVLVLAVLAFLARAARGALSNTVSLLTSMLLIALAVHVTPAEPLSEGLLGRTASSPIWYRVARLFTLVLPAVLWLCARRRHQRSLPSTDSNGSAPKPAPFPTA
jgi:hypothetical protein